ncbi:MAG: tRNA adenosine(34) deaminase TadA, partial [Gammaproteobacteria bacterium]
DEHWMRRALALARAAAAAGEVPVGAVLVRDGQPLAMARNAPIETHDPTAHAEIRVLRQAGHRVGNYRLPGSVLYVTLEPCPMCAGALVHARVERLVFGAADPRVGAAGTVFDLVDNQALNHRLAVAGGVLEPACRELLQGFFRERRD